VAAATGSCVDDGDAAAALDARSEETALAARDVADARACATAAATAASLVSGAETTEAAGSVPCGAEAPPTPRCAALPLCGCAAARQQAGGCTSGEEAAAARGRKGANASASLQGGSGDPEATNRLRLGGQGATGDGGELEVECATAADGLSRAAARRGRSAPSEATTAHSAGARQLRSSRSACSASARRR